MSNVKGPDNAPHRNQEFEQLVEQYQTAVLRTCYLYLCDKSLAEDAVQETFIKVFRGMDSFKGESSEKTWIMKIAMHTCYDINHSSWHRFFNRRVTPEMLPEAAVPFDDVDDELTNAVVRLPLKLREVILLYYLAASCGQREDGSLLYTGHCMISGETSRLTIIPVEESQENSVMRAGIVPNDLTESPIDIELK